VSAKTLHAVMWIDPTALERCFQVADLVDELFGRPDIEFAMLGLAARSCPLHVVATPLLWGQEVSMIGVYQSGHNVLRMRAEIATLAARLGQPLIPVAFIHSHHCGECAASAVDHDFLSRVFINHVAPLAAFRCIRRVRRGQSWCDCLPASPRRDRSSRDQGRWAYVPVEYSVAFSLIINRSRDRRLYAVRQEICPSCGTERIFEIPAQMIISPERTLSEAECECIRTQLRPEFLAKIDTARELVVGRLCE
jgi:hypothetical protein